jgi:hypothetical protein
VRRLTHFQRDSLKLTFGCTLTSHASADLQRCQNGNNAAALASWGGQGRRLLTGCWYPQPKMERPFSDPGVWELGMLGNDIGAANVYSLVSMLRECGVNSRPPLRALDLEANEVDVEGVNALASAALASCISALISVHVGCNQIEETHDHM